MESPGTAGDPPLVPQTWTQNGNELVNSTPGSPGVLQGSSRDPAIPEAVPRSRGCPGKGAFRKGLEKPSRAVRRGERQTQLLQLVPHSLWNHGPFSQSLGLLDKV